MVGSVSDPFLWLPQPKYSLDHVRGLALGAPYQMVWWSGRVADSHCDDFDYRAGGFGSKRDLKKFWGITGRDDAMMTMRALLDGMHAPELDEALATALPFRRETSDRQAELVQLVGRQSGPAAAQSVGETLMALSRPAMPELIPPTTCAWDLARMAMLARRSVAHGWCTPDDVLPLLQRGVDYGRQRIGGWPEYGASYVVGRALWCADEGPADVDESLDIHLPLLRMLLTDPNSPWNRLAW